MLMRRQACGLSRRRFSSSQLVRSSDVLEYPLASEIEAYRRRIPPSSRQSGPHPDWTQPRAAPQSRLTGGSYQAQSSQPSLSSSSPPLHLPSSSAPFQRPRTATKPPPVPPADVLTSSISSPPPPAPLLSTQAAAELDEGSSKAARPPATPSLTPSSMAFPSPSPVQSSSLRPPKRSARLRLVSVGISPPKSVRPSSRTDSVASASSAKPPTTAPPTAPPPTLDALKDLFLTFVVPDRSSTSAPAPAPASPSTSATPNESATPPVRKRGPRKLNSSSTVPTAPRPNSRRSTKVSSGTRPQPSLSSPAALTLLSSSASSPPPAVQVVDTTALHSPSSSSKSTIHLPRPPSTTEPSRLRKPTPRKARDSPAELQPAEKRTADRLEQVEAPKRVSSRSRREKPAGSPLPQTPLEDAPPSPSRALGNDLPSTSRITAHPPPSPTAVKSRRRQGSRLTIISAARRVGSPSQPLKVADLVVNRSAGPLSQPRAERKDTSRLSSVVVASGDSPENADLPKSTPVLPLSYTSVDSPTTTPSTAALPPSSIYRTPDESTPPHPQPPAPTKSTPTPYSRPAALLIPHAWAERPPPSPPPTPPSNPLTTGLARKRPEPAHVRPQKPVDLFDDEDPNDWLHLTDRQRRLLEAEGYLPKSSSSSSYR